MIKKILVFIFILFNMLQAYNLGEDFFPRELTMFFTSNNYNYFQLENEFVKETENSILKYNNFNNIKIKEILKDGSYSLGLYKGEEDYNFIIIKDLPVANYINSSFYNNTKFEKEILEDLTVNYLIGDEQFAFVYYDKKIYISNNINLFFKTINALKVKIDSIDQDENYRKLMQGDDYEYKIYLKNENEMEIYQKKYKIYSELKKREKILKSYLLEDNEDENLRDQNLNFSDYVVNEPDKIYIGKDINILKEKLSKDFEILNDFNFEDFSKKLQLKLKTILYVEKDGKFYIVLKTIDNWDGIEKDFVKLYEDNYMKGLKHIDLIKGDYGNYFRLPLTKIEKYIGIKNKENFIISENEDFLKDIKIGKYYNYKYSEIKSSKEIYKDYINNKFIEYSIKDGVLEESISIENKK